MDSASEDSNSPESRNMTAKIVKKCGELFESELFSDFTVAAYTFDGTLMEKKVHKNILCSQTEYFNNMMKADCAESKGNKVVVNGVQFNVVNEVLRFIYTGKVNNLNDMAFDLMGIADLWCMSDLFEKCERHLLRRLDEQNAVRMLRDILARKRDCLKSLKETVESKIVLHFIEIKETSEWLSFKEEYPVAAFQIYERKIDDLSPRKRRKN